MRFFGGAQRRTRGGREVGAAGTTGGFHPPPGSAAELQRVELRLRAVVSATPDPGLARMVLDAVDGGGKRLRPALVLASAAAARGPEAITEHVVDAAAAVELLHLASLHHDDVLDAAQVRRGLPSANALWGNHAAILGGDVLLAHTYRVAAGLGASGLDRIAHTLLALCSGQAAESASQFDCRRELAHYDVSVRGKTATLLSTSCWLGAATAGAPDDLAEAFAGFGMELGIAFQIIDDVLDLYGHGLQTGKLAGADLRAGVYTLPVLIALERDPGLVELLVEGIDEDGRREVARRVEAARADRRAVAYALEHLRAAFAHLDTAVCFAEGLGRLRGMAKLVLDPLERLRLTSGSRIRTPVPAAREASVA